MFCEVKPTVLCFWLFQRQRRTSHATCPCRSRSAVFCLHRGRGAIRTRQPRSALWVRWVCWLSELTPKKPTGKHPKLRQKCGFWTTTLQTHFRTAKREKSEINERTHRPFFAIFSFFAYYAFRAAFFAFVEYFQSKPPGHFRPAPCKHSWPRERCRGQGQRSCPKGRLDACAAHGTKQGARDGRQGKTADHSVLQRIASECSALTPIAADYSFLQRITAHCISNAIRCDSLQSAVIEYLSEGAGYGR